MTTTGRPERHRSSMGSALPRFRPRRGPARYRYPALAVGAVVAAMLTGGPSTLGVPVPNPSPAPQASAPVSVAGSSVPGPSVAAPSVAAPSAAAPSGPGPAADPSVAAASVSAAPVATAPVATAPVAAVPGGWAWPVGPPRELVHPFEAPASRYAAGHRGVDLVAGEGHPVRSPADGVVTFVGRVVDRPVLSIQHGEDLVSSFEPVTATVGEGDRVAAGQIVGVVATGSHCTARCVHFGVRRHGQYISPMLFLGGLARAVLLPLPPTGPVPHPARQAREP